MKIMTYNLRGGGRRPHHWPSVLDQFDPDILLLQESYPPSDHLPPLLHGTKAQNAVWNAAIGKNGELKWGSGVYAKSQRPEQIALSAFHGWVTCAELNGVDGRSIRAFSLHAPRGNGSYSKSVNEILDMLALHTEGFEVVIGGDFNLTVSERHESEEKATDSVDRKIQDRLRQEFGLINCWQTANPGLPLGQTLRWTNNPATPYHCDGIFVPSSWAERLISCDIISGDTWNKLSDHNPLIAEFAAG